MKLIKNLLLICLIIIFGSSCAYMKGEILRSKTPEEKLFRAAENNYQKRMYKNAFSLYDQYINTFPSGKLVPKALLRMGQTQIKLDNFSGAQIYFQRLIKNYPASTYARDAGIENLEAYYLAGQYHQVINEAEKVIIPGLTAEQSTRYHLIVGDSYLALRASLAAYHEFVEAYKSASSQDKDKVVLRLNMVLSLLPSSEIEQELRRLGDRPPTSYLMFALARDYQSEGKTQQALSTIKSFIEKYPDHEYIQQAKQLMADIMSAKPVEQKTIGCLLPLSGKYETFGQRSLKGIELAFTIFVRQRGNPPLKIDIEDSASDPSTAEQSITTLVNKHAIAIIGPIAASEEAAAKAQELKVPIITLTQKANITDAGDYVFRNFLTPEMQVKALISYTMGVLGVQRYAIFYPDETYGDTFMKLFKDEAEKEGAAVSEIEAYNPDQTDFEDSVKKLIGYANWKTWGQTMEENGQDNNMNTQDNSVNTQGNSVNTQNNNMNTQNNNNNIEQPQEEPDMEQQVEKHDEDELIPEVDFDAVFIPDSPEKAGLIIPLFAYYGVRNIYLLGTNLWHSEKMIQMTSSQIQGAIIPDGFFDQSKSDNVSAFVSEFKSAYGYTPGYIEAVSYDTAMMLLDLAIEPDVWSPDDMKQGLLDMPPYTGVTGLTSFAPNGDAVKDVYLLKVIGGKFKEIYYK